MSLNTTRVRKAVFPVAGLGTRFLPATKVLPKEMLTLLDRPLIQHAIEEARDAGIEQFILVINHGKDILVQHFDDAPQLIEILEQRKKDDFIAKVQASSLPDGSLQTALQTQALGLGHAVWCARALVGNEPFAVLLPDDVVQNKPGCLSQMIKQFETTGGNLVAVEEVSEQDTSKYGILDVGASSGALVEIKGLVEKPKPEDAPSRLAIIGRYILQPDIFEILSHREKGAGGEIQLTDAMAKLLGKQPFHGFRFAGKRFDCGSKLGFIEANISYALQDPDISSSVRKFISSL